MSDVARIGAVWKRTWSRVIAGQALAEEVVLRDGLRLRGVVLERTEAELILDLGLGQVTLPLSHLQQSTRALRYDDAENHAYF